MSLKVLFCCFAFATFFFYIQAKGLEIAFPEAWDGDSFRNESCPSKGIPKWLDGYFLVQICASYGKLSEPLGKKMTHMFDGFGAVASLKLHEGMVNFSG